MNNSYTNKSNYLINLIKIYIILRLFIINSDWIILRIVPLVNLISINLAWTKLIVDLDPNIIFDDCNVYIFIKDVFNILSVPSSLFIIPKPL